MKMKNYVLMFLLFLLSCSATARLFRPEDGDKGLKPTQINLADSLTTEINDLSDLMGLEKCEEENEECLKRKMMADAHLDYIYTQHHNP